jgi:hypothetical protein
MDERLERASESRREGLRLPGGAIICGRISFLRGEQGEDENK